MTGCIKKMQRDLEKVTVIKEGEAAFKEKLSTEEGLLSSQAEQASSNNYLKNKQL